jgi:hypothetical protein
MDVHSMALSPDYGCTQHGDLTSLLFLEKGRAEEMGVAVKVSTCIQEVLGWNPGRNNLQFPTEYFRGPPYSLQPRQGRRLGHNHFRPNHHSHYQPTLFIVAYLFKARNVEPENCSEKNICL